MASEISSSLCLKFARALTLLSSLKTLSGYSPRRLYKIQSFTHKSESQGYGDIVNKFSTVCFKKSFNFRIKRLQISNEMFTFDFTFVLWDRDWSLLVWIQCVPINELILWNSLQIYVIEHQFDKEKYLKKAVNFKLFLIFVENGDKA